MFMQVIDSTYHGFTTDTGEKKYVKNDNDLRSTGGQNFNGALLDDGKEETFGYPFTYDGTSGWLGWILASNDAMPTPPKTPPEMEDHPGFAVPNTYESLTATESFSTYLMYQPQSGAAAVWIALAEIDWSWSKTATNGPDGWTATAPTAQPNPTSLSPIGATAFPTWVNTASEFLDQDKNPWRPGA
jgi:hypothetical protein